VRISEFWTRMGEQFGESYAESLASDVVVRQLGGRTVRDALEAGEKPQDVWRAVCEAFEVPAARR
jgi:hypothetical protein